MIRVMNAFSGAVLHTFSVRGCLCVYKCVSVWFLMRILPVWATLKGYNNSKGLSLEACFTPDSQFVMIGECDPQVHVSAHFFKIVRVAAAVQVQRTGGSTCGALTTG